MEAAGIALGVAPFLAETVKQFVRLYRLIKRFRKCREGALELLECLETQRIIFQNETMLLLMPIFGVKKAKAMAEDANHPSWSDSMKKLDDMLAPKLSPKCCFTCLSEDEQLGEGPDRFRRFGWNRRARGREGQRAQEI